MSPDDEVIPATSHDHKRKKPTTTLEYWHHYTEIPSAWHVVSGGVEYFHAKLLLRNIWATKETQRAWAGESLTDAMRALHVEPFPVVPGMKEAVSLTSLHRPWI